MIELLCPNEPGISLTGDILLLRRQLRRNRILIEFISLINSKRKNMVKTLPIEFAKLFPPPRQIQI